MKNLILIPTFLFLFTGLFAQMPPGEDNCNPSDPCTIFQNNAISNNFASNTNQDDSIFSHRKDINTNSDSIGFVIESVGALSGKLQDHVDKFPPLVEQVGANSDCCAKLELPKVPIILQAGNILSSDWSVINPVTFKYKIIGHQMEIIWTFDGVTIFNDVGLLSFDIPANQKAKDAEFDVAYGTYKGDQQLMTVFVSANSNRVFFQRALTTGQNIWETSTGNRFQGRFQFEVL